MKNIVEAIDKYWRIVNFYTVASMYLDQYTVIDKEIDKYSLKEHPSGHWGTCPGINFIYSHINQYIKKYRRETQLIIGPGHGGNALLSNLYLECEATESLKQKEVYENCNIRTEINPYMPGTIYDGGELGYSLAVAFGTVLDKPSSVCVCIIGDGEAETGTLSSSWFCKDWMDCNSGFVLPILHLNGYKMGNASLLSYKNDEAISNYFSGLGYQTIIVHENHEEMIQALDIVEHIYEEIEQGKNIDWPIIIFKSYKGWTAPSENNIIIENTVQAHKNPLAGYDKDAIDKYVHKWLHSYHVEDFFDDRGKVKKEIFENIPNVNERLGNTLLRYKLHRLKLPDINDFKLELGNGDYRNICILEKYLARVIENNMQIFRIVSPDELTSNFLGALKNVGEVTKEKIIGDNKRIIEVLNENICQALMQGYILTGRNCLMISYEAFMPIITSMVCQYSKWLFQTDKIEWREETASFTYLLTSLCWSNTYSHQNPSFINVVLDEQFSFVRIFFPLDANSLLVCMDKCLKSTGKINVVLTSKQKMPQWLSLNDAIKGIERGIIKWDIYSNSEKSEPDIIFAAAGDYPFRECVEALKILRTYGMNINIRLIAVIELTVIGDVEIYPHALDKNKFNRYFSNDVPIIFSFHGYASAIKMLLFGRIARQRITILGYNNQSIASDNDLNKLKINCNSRYHIAIEAVRRLYYEKKITKEVYIKSYEKLQGFL